MKKYERGSKYFVGYYLYCVAKSLFVKFPEITGYIKDYDRDKFLTIHNQKITVCYLSRGKMMVCINVLTMKIT